MLLRAVCCRCCGLLLVVCCVLCDATCSCAVFAAVVGRCLCAGVRCLLFVVCDCVTIFFCLRVAWRCSLCVVGACRWRNLLLCVAIGGVGPCLMSVFLAVSAAGWLLLLCVVVGRWCFLLVVDLVGCGLVSVCCSLLCNCVVACWCMLWFSYVGGGCCGVKLVVSVLLFVGCCCVMFVVCWKFSLVVCCGCRLLL